jgi:hypothetical protein
MKHQHGCQPFNNDNVWSSGSLSWWYRDEPCSRLLRRFRLFRRTNGSILSAFAAPPKERWSFFNTDCLTESLGSFLQKHETSSTILKGKWGKLASRLTGFRLGGGESILVTLLMFDKRRGRARLVRHTRTQTLGITPSTNRYLYILHLVASQINIR